MLITDLRYALVFEHFLLAGGTEPCLNYLGLELSPIIIVSRDIDQVLSKLTTLGGCIFVLLSQVSVDF